jgi:hypothetical protein
MIHDEDAETIFGRVQGEGATRRRTSGITETENWASIIVRPAFARSRRPGSMTSAVLEEVNEISWRSVPLFGTEWRLG